MLKKNAISSFISAIRITECLPRQDIRGINMSYRDSIIHILHDSLGEKFITRADKICSIS
jgi:hypothetical protein